MLDRQRRPGRGMTGIVAASAKTNVIIDEGIPV